MGASAVIPTTGTAIATEPTAAENAFIGADFCLAGRLHSPGASPDGPG